jgi:hypothetical protein
MGKNIINNTNNFLNFILDKLLDFDNREIPSTEQDGGINVMSMGRNGSSLAWMIN